MSVVRCLFLCQHVLDDSVPVRIQVLEKGWVVAFESWAVVILRHGVRIFRVALDGLDDGRGRRRRRRRLEVRL